MILSRITKCMYVLREKNMQFESLSDQWVSWGKAKLSYVHYVIRQGESKLIIVFHHLPCVGPNHLCALAHIRCIREALLWSTGQDARLSNGRSAVQIWCSANAFELTIWTIRNPLLLAKAVDPQPAVSHSIIAYNWLVSWHVWGVRIRTGKTFMLGKASSIGARRDSNVFSS